MVKKTRFLALFLLLGLHGTAQIAQNANTTLNDLSFFVDVNNSKYKDAEGSKYLDQQFTLAKINNLDKVYPVRFDLVDNIMEFKVNDKDVKGVTPKQAYRIVFVDGSDRIFTSKTIMGSSNDLERCFLEEVHVGDAFLLYKRQRKKFQKAQPAKSGYEQGISAKFKVMNTQFYVDYIEDSIDYLLEIPRTKKKVKSFFGESGDALIKYAKKERLAFDSKESLVKILEYRQQIR